MDGSKLSQAKMVLKTIQSNYEEKNSIISDSSDLQKLIFFYKSPLERTKNERFLMPDGKYQQIDTTEFVSDFIPTYSEYMNTYDTFTDDINLWDSESNSYIEQKPLRHQKYVLQYLNNNTPFRGLLYYHGLGSGKTGASIMTAAGYSKETIILTPASLQGNFRGEILQRFGHNYLKQRNHWKWMPLKIDIPGDEKYSRIKIHIELIRLKNSIKSKKKFNASELKTIELFSPEGIDPTNPSEKQKLIEYLDDIDQQFKDITLKITKYMELIKQNLPVTTRKAENTMGVWLIDENEDDNYLELTDSEREEIDKQITKLLNVQYKFFNYNASGSTIPKILDALLDKEHLNKKKIEFGIHEKLGISEDDTKKITKISTNKFSSEQIKDLLEHVYDESNTDFQNPFDNKVVIIDEIHNLTSRITSGSIIALRLYELLMRAKNMNIILLSGTPAINTPYQLAVTFNILKGTTTIFRYDITSQTEDMDQLKKLLFEHPIIDKWKLVGRSIQFTVVREGFMNNFIDGDRNGLVQDKSFRELSYLSLQDSFKKFFIENGYIGEISIKHKSLFPDCLQDKIGVHSLLDKKILDIKKNEFNEKYVNSDLFVINQAFKVDFQKRIVGLVSHYNEISIEGEDVFPSVTFAEPSKVRCELSDYQFLIYMNKRIKESELEEQNMKRSIIDGDSQSLSYYKVLTRQSGNFVFPSNLPRPEPSEFRKLKKENTYKYQKQKEILSLLLNETSDEQILTKQQIVKTICDRIIKDADSSNPLSFKNIYIELINSLELEKKIQFSDFEEGCDEIVGDNFENIKLLDFNDVDELVLKNIPEAEEYETVLERNISELSKGNLTLEQSEIFNLHTLSPKFVKILENIYETPGLVFGYSQFKAAEGVGIFSKVLEMNGYTPFSTRDTTNTLEVDKMVRYYIDDDTQWKTGKVKAIGEQHVELYGVDVSIEKEKVFLCKFTTWAGETSIEDRQAILNLFNQSSNKYGQQCLILLGTSAISEGISLKYVRQVHIFEPYWNEIRVKQVIGRARRFRSHVELPEDQRNVEVFNYFTSFSDKQKSSTIVDDLEKTLVTNTNYFSNKSFQEDFQTEFDMNKASFTTIIQKDDLLTSDESLERISEKKTRLLTDFLKIMKETSIDCEFNKLDNIRSDETYSTLECLQLVTGNKTEKYDTTHTYDFEPISGDIIQQKKVKLQKMLITYNKYKILFLIPEPYKTISEYLQDGFSVYGYNFYKYYNLEQNINPLYSEEIIGELIIDFKGDMVFNFLKSADKIKGIPVNNRFTDSKDYYVSIQSIIDSDYSDLLSITDRTILSKKISEIKSKLSNPTSSLSTNKPKVVKQWKCPLCKNFNPIGSDCMTPECNMSYKKYLFLQKKKKKKSSSISSLSTGTASSVGLSSQSTDMTQQSTDMVQQSTDMTQQSTDMSQSLPPVYVGTADEPSVEI